MQQRETKAIDLGNGYAALIVTYFTMGERNAISDLWGQMAESVPLKDANGSESNVVYRTGRTYQKASRDLEYNTSVKAVTKDGVAIDAPDMASAVEMLPESCGAILRKELNALSPTPEQKKTSPTV